MGRKYSPRGFFMKGTDSGKSKIQKICDIIKTETIEPAQQEAREIIENAHLRAEEIIRNAEKKAKGILGHGEKEIEQRKRVFESSMNLASRQALESLRQKIENELFHPALAEAIHKSLSQPDMIAKLMTAVIQGIEKEGIDSDLTALVGKSVSPKQINELLLKHIVERMREKGVIVGDFKGGIKVVLHQNRITIDISEEALRELIGSYVRKEFREMLFQVKE